MLSQASRDDGGKDHNMSENEKNDILGNITDTVSKMYDGDGDLLDRVDETLHVKETAKKMGVSEEDIEKAEQAGKKAFVDKANSILGTNLKL